MNNSTYKLSTSDYMIATAIILMVISAILMIIENGYIDQLFVYIYILLVVGTFIKYFEFVIKE